MSAAPAGRRLPPWPVWAAAAFAFLFCALYNILVFDRVPHIHDEAAYLFQARIFLAGGPTAPLPPVPEAFDFPHVVNVGRWYTIYPPGFPLLLALGLLAGAPWLVNPILAGLAVLLLFGLGAEIYDRRTGLLASVLGALSIWLLLMSSTMMSHTASMVFNAVFLLFFFKSLRAPTFAHGLAAGAGLGLAFLIRPYNAAVLALPFLLVLGLRSLARLKLRWRNLAGLALAGGLCLGAFLAYNAATTGEPLKPGYIARYGPAYSVIFGRAATLDYDFTPLVSAMQIGENMAELNRTLFGWPLTSFWLLPFAFWAGLRRREERGRDLLLLSGFASMTVGFFFFWGAFIVLGARMFFDALPLLVLLSAKGLARAPELLAARFPRLGPAGWGKAAAGLLAVFSLYAFAVRFPAWVGPKWSEWYYERCDHNLCGSSAWIGNALKPLPLGKSVVVMKMLYAPLTGFPTGWWGSGFIYDAPRLDGGVLFANDRGDDVTRRLMRAFPDRAFYAYVGTLEKGLLVPLREEDGAVRRGRPLVSAAKPRRAVDLLASPDGLFKMYSPGFRAFVEDRLRGDGWTRLDVESLRAEGARLQQARDFQGAAYAFEAALQLEKNPKVRWPILISLGQCYFKTGQAAEAKRVSDKFAEAGYRGKKLFHILPARGF